MILSLLYIIQVFYEIAKKVLENSGIVFGAVFNEKNNVVLSSTDSLIGLRKMQGSKYVQATVKDSYKDAEKILKAGKQVLFSGTSCQIGGLYAYLGQDYKNLITMDFVCHGVPSPKAWYQYIKSLENKFDSKIDNISFRNKDNGWQTFSLKINFINGRVLTEKVNENIYLRSFVNNYILRSSCFECAYKQIHKQSDITVADFWGIEKWNARLNDNKGASVVFLHSRKAEKLFYEIKNCFDTHDISFDEAIINNPAYLHSSNPNALQKAFEKKWRSMTFCRAVEPFFSKGKFADCYRKGKLLTNWQWK